MTQLFDTETYEDRSAGDESVAEQSLATRHTSRGRHLRSMPAGDDIGTRSTQWRLDEHTIEIGRKGIQAARAALQEAARTEADEKTERRAA